jgi:hypothetical protein
VDAKDLELHQRAGTKDVTDGFGWEHVLDTGK